MFFIIKDGLLIINHMFGHDKATCDSHLTLPRVTTTLDELTDTYLEKYHKILKYNGL